MSVCMCASLFRRLATPSSDPNDVSVDNID